MGDFYFVPPTQITLNRTTSNTITSNQTTAKLTQPHEPTVAPQVAAVMPSRSQAPEQALTPAPQFNVETPEVDKPAHQNAQRDYNREGYEIEIKAKTLTSDELPALIAKAEQGEVIAQTTLGWAYLLGKGMLDGRGIPRKNKEVVKWTRAAAAKGYPVAQNNMGAMHMDGVAVKLDYHQAQHYFKLASDQGYLAAQIHLYQVNTLLAGKVDMDQVAKINQSVQQQMKQPVQ
jgi:TPR repeat protein